MRKGGVKVLGGGVRGGVR